MKIINSLTFITFFCFSSLAQTDDGRKFTIPVIFHIIYIDDNPDNGMSDEVKRSSHGNSTTHLPKEKIQAEIDELNKDFQLLNDTSKVLSEYKSVVGNPKIQFSLREILYTQVRKSAIWALLNNSDKLHALSKMQKSDSCLNVYISVLKVNGGGSEGVTNVPIDGLPESDAVNLNYSWVGLGYHLLSHEVGHWLGLWHVDDNNQISLSKVTDIPVQTGRTDIDCVKCTEPDIKVVSSQQAKFANPNTNNYMDYSGCRSMFSVQQCAYMRSIIMKFRPGIWK